MQVVSIDFFSVPDESAGAFQEESRKAQRIIKNVSGFVEGYTYKQLNGDSDYNFVTMAVWESKEAFDSAGNTVWSEFQKQNFNPQAVFAALGVKRVRSEYTRTPY